VGFLATNSVKDVLDATPTMPTPALLRTANIEPRFWPVALDKIPDGLEYKQQLVAYLSKLPQALEEGVGLLLYGEPRSGTTSAAIIVLKRALAHKASSYFIRADDLVRGVVEKQEHDIYTLEDYLDYVSFLTIDDIGQKHLPEFGRGIIERVLRHRNAAKLPTIATLSGDPNDLPVVYGDATCKLILSCMAPIHVGGVDWYALEKQEVKKFTQ
jgi:DNA replication protein DnaC